MHSAAREVRSPSRANTHLAFEEDGA